MTPSNTKREQDALRVSRLIQNRQSQLDALPASNGFHKENLMRLRYFSVLSAMMHLEIKSFLLRLITEENRFRNATHVIREGNK